MRTLKFKKADWDKLWNIIKAEHPPSIMISWVCKRDLGFTIRDYTPPPPRKLDRSNYSQYSLEVHLDFYDEQLQTMFILKYSDYIR